MSVGVSDEAVRAARAKIRGGAQISIDIKDGDRNESLAVAAAPGAVGLTTVFDLAQEWLESAAVQMKVNEWSEVTKAQAKRDAVVVPIDTLEYSPVPGGLRMYTKFSERVADSSDFIDMLVAKTNRIDISIHPKEARKVIEIVIESLGGWGFTP